MILAIETATNICSVSFLDREGEIHEKRTERRGSHSELLFIFIRELMEEHEFSIQDLEAVLVSNGPGSYTGLRIAASAVKGILFGYDVDVYTANTLAGFAMGALYNKSDKETKNLRIHAVINARRKHLYHQEFSFDEQLKPITGPQILELDVIESMLSPGDWIVGTGIDRLSSGLLEKVEQSETETISAASLIRLFKKDEEGIFFKQTTAEELESNYISSSQVNNSNI